LSIRVLIMSIRVLKIFNKGSDSRGQGRPADAAAAVRAAVSSTHPPAFARARACAWLDLGVFAVMVFRA
jgi:hypothetical protein